MAGVDGADGTADVMRRQGDIVHIRQIGDTASFGQATCLGQIRANDIRGLVLYQFPESVPRVEVFTGAYRCACGLRDFGHSIHVFRRDRILEP